MNNAKSPKVVAIVLTWNSVDFIERCIDSLLNSTFKPEIVVVDNDSADDTRQLIKKKFPKLELINSGSNLGYAGGNNFGIRYVEDRNADYIFILNPDAYVAKNCIELLVKRMEEEKILAACSPMIYNHGSNIINYAGSSVNWKSGATPHIGGGQIDKGQFDESVYTGRLNGCAMLMRMSAITKVGLMDENYFLYYEEADWSVRLIDAGYKPGLVPKSKVWHAASSSTGGQKSGLYYYYMTRNRLYFMKKYKDKTAGFYVLRMIPGQCIVLLVILKNMNISLFLATLGAYVKAYKDHILQRCGKQT